MTYLLDVSTLIALLWDLHMHNERVTRWQNRETLAVCPLTELGFLRISTQPTFGATVAEARRMLRDWKRARKPEFVPCDLDSLDSDEPTTGSRTTDFYLASLASKHGMRLATLDESIGHKAVFLNHARIAGEIEARAASQRPQLATAGNLIADSLTC